MSRFQPPAPDPVASYAPPDVPTSDTSSLPPDVVEHIRGQMGLIGQRGGSAIAPAYSEGTGKQVPLRNATGDIVGYKREDAPPLFQNPFTAKRASALEPNAEDAPHGTPAGPPPASEAGPPEAAPQQRPQTSQAGVGGYDSRKLEDLRRKQLELVDAETQAQVDSNIVLQAQRRTQAQEYEERSQGMQARQEARQAKIQEVMDKRQVLSDAVASGKIDPDRLYGHADTGTRIGLVLGAAIGGAFQGWNHLNSNPFLDSVNLAIQRDIDAQKEQLASKKFALSENTNMLGQLRAQFGDARQGDLAAQEIYLQGTKMQLEATLQGVKNPVLLANGEQAKNALELRYEEIKKQASDHAAALASAAAAQGSGYTADELREFGERRAKEDIPAQKQAIEDVWASFPKTGPIKGIGPKYDLAAAMPGSQYVLSTEVLQNRANVSRVQLALQHMITGAGGSDEERNRINKLVNTGSAEGIRAAIQETYRIADAKDRNIKATSNPNAVREAERREAALKGPGLPAAFGRNQTPIQPSRTEELVGGVNERHSMPFRRPRTGR